MMKRILMVLVIGVVVSASAVQASHLAFSESFNYANASDGDALGAATGDRWEIAQQGGSERGDFDTTNLTYPGYYDGGGGSAVTSGNALSRISTDGADGTALKALDSTPGTYYASALINGNADWWFRTYKVLINHQKPTVQYQSADSAIYDTGVTKGSGPGGTDLLVVMSLSTVVLPLSPPRVDLRSAWKVFMPLSESRARC